MSTPHVLVLADSLAYHGPAGAERPDHPDLWTSVMASELNARVDLLARLGWTTRDAWWALTKDPNSWGTYVPRADAMVIAVGGMDQLPAIVPTYLREGIPYMRPATLRSATRRAYLSASPRLMRVARGPFRQLPQRSTESYLSRIVAAMRFWHPGLPVLLLGPAPHSAQAYPVHRFHAPAVVATRRWAAANDALFLDLDPIVAPAIATGDHNPDGIHWGWTVHKEIGRLAAEALRIPLTNHERAH